MVGTDIKGENSIQAGFIHCQINLGELADATRYQGPQMWLGVNTVNKEHCDLKSENLRASCPNSDDRGIG